MGKRESEEGREKGIAGRIYDMDEKPTGDIRYISGEVEDRFPSLFAF